MSRHLDLNTAISVKTALKVLSPGMYTARYVGSQAQDAKVAGPQEKGQPAEHKTTRANIPLAFTQAPIQMSGVIEFVCPEHVANQTLTTPGDYLLLNVKHGDAVLAVSKYAPRALGENVDVHWRIEPLHPQASTSQRGSSNTGSADNSPNVSSATSSTLSSTTPPSKTAAPASLSVLGHVERQGDVRVSAGEWLGDPNSKARLEGFQVIWPQKPDDVSLVAGCKAGQATQQIKDDEFLGTRQKATPISQLAVCLNGPGASEYQLNGEAAFSDGSREPLGAPKAVTGSSGSYLVAVRLAITPTQPEAPASSARSRWLDPENTYIRQR